MAERVVSGFSELFRAEQFPVLQNRTYDSREAAVNCAKGDLRLVQDLKTGFIFNELFDPALVRYDREYHNEQSFSPAFRRHLDDVADRIQQHFKGMTLIEVGCGKGHFLELLQQRGCPITGLDPSYEGDNPAIVAEYFTPAVGLKADGIILRHVLEHIPDPVRFLENIRDANGGRGRIYIEVPCFDWIREHRAWFDIFYEHVNYFRIDDFRRIFGELHFAEHCFGGQYISVIAELASLRASDGASAAPAELPRDFLDSVNQHAAWLSEQSRAAPPVLIWGGASKGVIFALYMQRAGAPIRAVVDMNRAKQNRYLPATGLEVWSPEKALSTMPQGTAAVVMNSNYLAEIERLTGDRFRLIPVD